MISTEEAEERRDLESRKMEAQLFLNLNFFWGHGSCWSGVGLAGRVGGGWGGGGGGTWFGCMLAGPGGTVTCRALISVSLG